VGVENDDWTHLDMGDYPGSNEDAEQMYASITGTLEVLGWLTHEGEADEPGYFDCVLCSETQCGGGQRFLTHTDMDGKNNEV
tara:strand:+ start:2812 stop:3057 length:246 start_codon:yes stop_codon:yes gene_type:complete